VSINTKICTNHHPLLRAKGKPADPSGRSGNIVGRINEVTVRRAWLVLGWVIVFRG